MSGYRSMTREEYAKREHALRYARRNLAIASNPNAISYSWQTVERLRWDVEDAKARMPRDNALASAHWVMFKARWDSRKAALYAKRDLRREEKRLMDGAMELIAILQGRVRKEDTGWRPTRQVSA